MEQRHENGGSCITTDNDGREDQANGDGRKNCAISQLDDPLANQPEEYKQAYVTLALTNDYALAALVLAHSLRETQTKRDVVCVVDNLKEDVIALLKTGFDKIFSYSTLVRENQIPVIPANRSQSSLGGTLSKLICWQLIGYDKAIFIDADCLVLKNVDELFNCAELSAAPECGWPDCFSSGVFVFKPSNETCRRLHIFAAENSSFDGGDQGILNKYFSQWRTESLAQRLSIQYNFNPALMQSNPPAYRKFGGAVKIVHFVGPEKPWLWERECLRERREEERLVYVLRWWDVCAAHCDSKMLDTFTIKGGGVGNFTTEWKNGLAIHKVGRETHD